MKELTGWAKCPGTCGEWVQGAKDGVPFLVGCPVNRFVEVSARSINLGKNVREETQTPDLRLWNWDLPKGKEKTRFALERLIQTYNRHHIKAKLQFHSELPIGKGMASSTADMVAAMVAVAELSRISWDSPSLARLALEIEPTDPVMFEGITEFAHRDGSYVKALGPVIPAKLLMLDWGKSLDTLRFNALNGLSEHYRRKQPQIKQALTVFYEGMETRDLERVAWASTLSAQCNQEINPKPEFEQILSWVLEQGGLGVVTAHSGTILAGVFPVDMSQKEYDNLQLEAVLRFKAGKVEWVDAHNGGVQGGSVDAWRESLRGHGTVRKELIY